MVAIGFRDLQGLQGLRGLRAPLGQRATKAIQASRVRQVHQVHQVRQVRQAQGVQQVHLLDLRGLKARLEIALKEWGRLGGLIPRTFPKLWTALARQRRRHAALYWRGVRLQRIR